MEQSSQSASRYHRYHIETKPIPDIVTWPNRFLVKVNRYHLAILLIQEVFHQRGDIKAITSRPCIYGTFSGPIGGFAPRPQHCVGCLRCTVQHPDATKIIPNPARLALGDSYFHFEHINAVAYEAGTGSIPVKGAGYRGKFGGSGWDGMWTDMSEIVRPTRDGIHGREFISTVVDIGEKPSYLVFDEDGNPVSAEPRIFSIPIPFIYDSMPPSITSRLVARILCDAAAQSETLAVMPLENIIRYKLNVESLVPLIKIGEENQLASLPFTPKMFEINFEYSPFPNLHSLITNLQASFPDTILALRLPFIDGQTLLGYAESGIRVFHLVADFHGRGSDGRFVFDLIRDAHLAFVKAGIRDEVTLIGSGGIVAAEHVPKAIIAGLDLVALDTPLLVAMQAQFDGKCADRQTSQFSLPKGFVRSDDFNHRKTASNPTTSREYQWGLQRLKNMTAAWRDQVLEILGAMGLREVRRLRGEIGRAMFQADLEHEAFAEIEGYK